jgi:KTSC domain
MSMQRTPVSSSNIESIGYSPDIQLLEIEFKNGNVYQYFDIPQTTFDALMSASSHGTFFAASIRGVFRFARV